MEHKQESDASKMNRIEYEFIHADYIERMEFFKVDISKKLSPDIVSRSISLSKLKYGNKTDIEAALVSS